MCLFLLFLFFFFNIAQFVGGNWTKELPRIGKRIGKKYQDDWQKLTNWLAWKSTRINESLEELSTYSRSRIWKQFSLVYIKSSNERKWSILMALTFTDVLQNGVTEFKETDATFCWETFISSSHINITMIVWLSVIPLTTHRLLKISSWNFLCRFLSAWGRF